jgi:16S rRNA (guanine(966)-N(2))-methyltransferase RsmD
VRESVFNRLGDLQQARVLDLFAGSGALGIEAISRGAERLVAVDRAGRVVRALEQSVEALGIADLVTAWRLDARGAIRRLADAGERFDLVFVDPPYDADEYTPVLTALVESGILESGARVVVERAKRHALAPISGLEVEAERSYGDTVVSWLVTCESGKSIGGNGS